MTRRTQNMSLKNKVVFVWRWKYGCHGSSWGQLGQSQLWATVAMRPKAHGGPPRVWIRTTVFACGPILSHTASVEDVTRVTGCSPVWSLQQLETQVPILIQQFPLKQPASDYNLFCFLLPPVKFSISVIQQSYGPQLTMSTFLMGNNYSSLTKGSRRYVYKMTLLLLSRTRLSNGNTALLLFDRTVSSLFSLQVLSL